MTIVYTNVHGTLASCMDKEALVTLYNLFSSGRWADNGCIVTLPSPITGLAIVCL